MRPPTRTRTRRLARVSLLVSALLAAAPTAAAQAQSGTVAPADSSGAVRGTVVDSIAAGPLAGATVQLVARENPLLSYTATSDATGAFHIGGMPPGTYLAGFFHPRLDSLGLRSPTYLVSVDSGETLFPLAIPSPSTIITGACGDGTADQTGLLLGRVRDATNGNPHAGATVAASWFELVIDERGVGRERRQIAATTDGAGEFAICGLPADAELVIQADHAGQATGEIALAVPSRGLLHRELLLGAGGDRAAVAGVVRHADGRPFAGARVMLHGAQAADTTGDDGRFALDSLPTGTHTLEVRAIGFTPVRVPVDITVSATDTVAVKVDERVATLDAVTVYGERRRSSQRLDAFMNRRNRGHGRFLTADEIEQRRAFDTADLFRTMPGVRVAPTGSFHDRLVMRGGVNECTPGVFLDGMRLHDGASQLSSMIHPHQIAGVEVYTNTATVPPQFHSGSCGAIVVWTRGSL